MPHKFHAGRRDKFPKAKYAVTNWSDYNEALRRRGDVTIWLEDGTAGKWFAPKRKGRGGQPKYSDFAIETCLTLGLIFHKPLRQPQGFVRSLRGLMGVELPVPDFSTLSRRAIGLSVVDDRPQSSGPITLIVDSTGLKIHRGSGWQETKHGTGKTRKSWRKLHIGYDPNSGEIVASLLTTDHVGDETALPELIAVIENPVARVLADGAYDGARVSNWLTEAFGTDVEITIPPPITAVLGLSDGRDAHIEHIAEHGRMASQAATGYNDRALVDAQIGRRKFVIGPELNAREMNRQLTENQIATKNSQPHDPPWSCGLQASRLVTWGKGRLRSHSDPCNKLHFNWEPMAAIKAITSDLGHAERSHRSIADRLTLQCPSGLGHVVNSHRPIAARLTLRCRRTFSPKSATHATWWLGHSIPKTYTFSVEDRTIVCAPARKLREIDLFRIILQA